jgi:uncharacterized membrane protein
VCIFAVCLLAPNLFTHALSENTSTSTFSQQETEGTYLGKVISINSSEVKEVPNTTTSALYQNVTIEFITGDRSGTRVRIDDSAFALNVGDKAYVKYLKSGDSIFYSVQEPYRLDSLFILLGIFIITVLILGGKQGFLALFALFVSFGVIFKFLFPQLLTGGNVVVLSTLGALLSLFVVMYLTHGFTRMTTAAFAGCSISVFVTLMLAKYAVSVTMFTGFASEESVYLNIATHGQLDFVALLVAGIIIGVVGVVDDASITQASLVQELMHADPTLQARHIYAKAMKVGKDHIGAVINTLILAYTGAALPIVLLLYTSSTPILELINREAIATEIVRGIVGSVGILCAVPATTLIAIFLLKNKQNNGKVHKSIHTHHH